MFYHSFCVCHLQIRQNVISKFKFAKQITHFYGLFFLHMYLNKFSIFRTENNRPNKESSLITFNKCRFSKEMFKKNIFFPQKYDFLKPRWRSQFTSFECSFISTRSTVFIRNMSHILLAVQIFETHFTNASIFLKSHDEYKIFYWFNFRQQKCTHYKTNICSDISFGVNSKRVSLFRFVENFA